MLKTKHTLSALAFLAAMTIATSAFAQGVFTVSSSIEPRARMNGQTEEAGGVTLTLSSGTVAAEDNGSVSIDYGTRITNTVATNPQEPGDGIAVLICNGAATTVPDDSVTRSGSVLTIQVGGVADRACTTTGNSIDVSGVRLAIAGQGLSDVQANITSSGDVRLSAGANEVTVINSVVDELVDDGVTADTVTLIRHTANPQPRSMDDGTYFKLHIEENAVDSFENAALNLHFSGIPTGGSVEIDAWVSTKDELKDLEPTQFVIAGDDPATADTDESAPADTSAPVSATNQNPSTYNFDNMSQLAFQSFTGTARTDRLVVTLSSMSTRATVLTDLGNALTRTNNPVTTQDETTALADFGGSLDENEIDVIVIRGKFIPTRSGSGAISLPLGDLDIAVSVDVGPSGAAVPMGPTAYRGIPRFASEPTMAVTVIGVTSDRTMLRVPFAAVIGDSWDTGVAIANTNTASDQMGAITFHFFGGGESMDPFTTMNSSVGNGLNDDGMLEAGGTYSVQLSDVLEAAGHDPAFFSGYVDIVTDFTEARGFVFLSSFAGGAWGAAGAIEDITPP